MKSEKNSFIALFEEVKFRKPRVHMIPNQVTTAFCADMIAVTGARPIMALGPEDVADITAQADSLVINLGQLNEEKIKAVTISLDIARVKNMPIVVDPVGIGASAYRLKHGIELIEKDWKGIVKCNASEYDAIVHKKLTYTGVDAEKIVDRKQEVYSNKSKYIDKCFYITGKKDRLLAKKQLVYSEHQDTRLPVIVGSGCALGALIGTYYSCAKDEMEAMILASVVMTIGAMKAEAKAVGYMDFKHYLIDAVYSLTADELITYSEKIIGRM